MGMDQGLEGLNPLPLLHIVHAADILLAVLEYLSLEGRLRSGDPAAFAMVLEGLAGLLKEDDDLLAARMLDWAEKLKQAV